MRRECGSGDFNHDAKTKLRILVRRIALIIFNIIEIKYITILFLFLIYCCKKESVNDAEIVQLIEQKKADNLNERNYIAVFDDISEKNTKLTKKELRIVNRFLIMGVAKYNNDLKIKLDEWNKQDKTLKWNFEEEKIDLKNYYRQYFVVNNENGDKSYGYFAFVITSMMIGEVTV